MTIVKKNRRSQGNFKKFLSFSHCILILVAFLYRARRMQQSSYRRIVKARIILKPRRRDTRSGSQFDPAFSTPIPPHVHFRLELITTWCNKEDAYFYASCGTRRSRRLLKFIGSPVASLLLLRYSRNPHFLFLSLSLFLSHLS